VLFIGGFYAINLLARRRVRQKEQASPPEVSDPSLMIED
jgi:hypothetical protein